MILKILNDKHPMLRTICSYVVKPSDFSKFAMSMFTTMKAHKAVGLAANQVGKSVRIITIDTPDFSGTMFNPEILERSQDFQCFPEGCLSVKNTKVNTGLRAQAIMVKWLDKNDIINVDTFNGLTSVVIQHEIDHLNGILMTDYDDKENTKPTLQFTDYSQDS